MMGGGTFVTEAMRPSAISRLNASRVARIATSCARALLHVACAVSCRCVGKPAKARLGPPAAVALACASLRPTARPGRATYTARRAPVIHTARSTAHPRCHCRPPARPAGVRRAAAASLGANPSRPTAAQQDGQAPAAQGGGRKGEGRRLPVRTPSRQSRSTAHLTPAHRHHSSRRAYRPRLSPSSSGRPCRTPGERPRPQRPSEAQRGYAYARVQQV